MLHEACRDREGWRRKLASQKTRVWIGILVVLTSGIPHSACTYIGYRTGGSIDGYNFRKFPEGLALLESLEPDQRVDVMSTDGKVVSGRFLGLVLADGGERTSDATESYVLPTGENPLPGAGDAVSVSTRNNPQPVEGEIVGYGYGTIHISTAAGPQSIQTSMVQVMVSEEGTRFKADEIRDLVARERMKLFTAVQVQPENATVPTVHEIPISEIRSVRTPSSRWRPFTTALGAAIDLFFISCVVVGTVADAQD